MGMRTATRAPRSASGSPAGTTFSIDDADELAAQAIALGGAVLLPPVDVPWARMTVIADPQGASFIATRFAPENR
jgi:predicted enzyme related to lactoylglutathione lyase